MDFIERLREKPPKTKKIIAFATSAIVTLVIFGVWVSVLRVGIDIKAGDATAVVANSSETDVDPLSAFWSVISKGWSGLTDSVNQVKTVGDNVKGFVVAPESQEDVFILDNITQ